MEPAALTDADFSDLLGKLPPIPLGCGTGPLVVVAPGQYAALAQRCDVVAEGGAIRSGVAGGGLLWRGVVYRNRGE